VLGDTVETHRQTDLLLEPFSERYFYNGPVGKGGSNRNRDRKLDHYYTSLNRSIERFMKKFYILLFAVPVLLFTILYLSIWWFLAAVAVVMIFTAYRFYAARLEAMRTENEILEQQVEELHIQLDNSIVKEQKASKEAENVRQLKQQLLTIMSHEIRTPMNGVMGMSLLLTDTPLNTEQQEYVKTIRNCGESLLTTVNDILANDALDFSKLDREEKKLDYKDLDLRDCVEETLDMFATRAAKTGFDLLYEIDANVPA